MSMKGDYVKILMAMAMMSDSMPLYTKTTPLINLGKKPPTGSKEYFFNKDGEYSTDHMLKTECVFECFAINDKNAKRKFNKWIELTQTINKP
jgi:hypothetical protein